MANNTYILEWYGPFNCLQDVCDWEDKNIGRWKTFLYLFQGKKKYAHEKLAIYCGQAFRQSVGKRLKNKNHHICEVVERRDELEIWVAKFANKKPQKYDVNLVEKVLTSVLDQVIKSDTDEILNETNKLRPKDTAYIINEWYYIDGRARCNYPSKSICSRIPDVLACYSNEDGKVANVWGCQRMKFIDNLK